MRGVNRPDEEASLQQRVQGTAVKLASHPGIETQEVAAALNIHPFMLSRWKKEYREGKLQGPAHPSLKAIRHLEETVAEHQRIRQLEAALKKARIENDLLKKLSSSLWNGGERGSGVFSEYGNQERPPALQG